MDANSFWGTDSRDKLCLLALFIFGIFAFLGLFMGKDTATILTAIVGTFAAAYKGSPTTSQPPATPAVEPKE